MDVIFKSNKPSRIDLKKKFKIIDSLRGISSVYVLLCHIAIHIDFGNANLSFLEKLTVYPLIEGHYAVNLFIFLSGYSLTAKMATLGTYKLNSVLIFYYRRIKRIYPPYAIALVLSTLLIHFYIGKVSGTHWDMSLPWSKRSFLYHIVMIHDIFNDTIFNINHAFWSISVEMRIYFLFPGIIYIYNSYGLKFTSFAVVVFSILCFLTSLSLSEYFDISLGWPGVSPYIILFFLGIVAADLTLNKSHICRQTKFLEQFCLILTVVILLLVYLFSKSIYWRYWYQILDILFGFLILQIFLLSKLKIFRPVKRILSLRWLVWLGSISYSLYLIHAPLIQVFWIYFVFPKHLSNLHSYYLLLTCVPLILAVAYLFNKLFERPFMNYKRL